MGGASECIKSYSEAPFKEKLKICWNYFQAERLIYKNTRDHMSLFCLLQIIMILEIHDLQFQSLLFIKSLRKNSFMVSYKYMML